MRIPVLLCVLYILGVDSRDIRSNENNVEFIENCKGQNTNNASLEISNCLHPIEIKPKSDKAVYPYTNLRFNNVIIDNIVTDALKNFPDLDHIEFNSSEIKNMDEQAFFRSELATLSFTNCKFEYASDINIQCMDLEELVINNSNLKRIPKFNDLPSLTILNLDYNRINTIKSDVFESLSSLEEVYLTNNEITNFSPKIFHGEQLISVLDLSHNLLTSFELEGASQLEILSLAHNQLKRFDSNSSKTLKNLKSLDLSYNKISEISQATFKNMPYLDNIDLSYNKLRVLDDNVFSFNSNLEKLILDGNNFKTLPTFRSGSNFYRMYNLSCKKCGLVALSSFTFKIMPELVQLTLSDNNLETLDPKAFASLTALKILDLSNNKLTKLGKVFSDNKELTEINLSGNPLISLDPKVFISLTNLKKLDASNAQLTSLWADNYEYVLNDLEQLTIANNSIDDITTNDLKVMPNLKYIDLENNPIQCTIHLAHLVKWLTSHDVLSTEGASLLRTNEKLLDDAAHYFEDTYDHKSQWFNLALKSCKPSDNNIQNRNNDLVMQYILQNDKDTDSVPKVSPPRPAVTQDIEDESEDDDSDEDGYDDDAETIEDADIDRFRDDEGLNQTTYIISVTSVFVITVLIVLSATVSITLVILKKHNTMNINNANLPRFKIPRWETMPSHKKHSGSIYRPLSEEILAPPTPKINRYEFKTSPTVHNPNA